MTSEKLSPGLFSAEPIYFHYFPQLPLPKPKMENMNWDPLHFFR